MHRLCASCAPRRANSPLSSSNDHIYKETRFRIKRATKIGCPTRRKPSEYPAATRWSPLAVSTRTTSRSITRTSPLSLTCALLPIEWTSTLVLTSVGTLGFFSDAATETTTRHARIVSRAPDAKRERCRWDFDHWTDLSAPGSVESVNSVRGSPFASTFDRGRK